MAKVLAINAGSSTLKWKLFSLPEETVIASGMVDRLGLPQSKFVIKKADGEKYTETKDTIDAQEAAAMVLTRLKSDGILAHLSEITGVGHRVVAGGEDFKDSVVITPTTLKQIKDLSEYAPLHNPTQAYYIEVFQQLLPKAVQVAVFDTSLYATMPEANYLYSLPYDYYKQFGARKYGAHGTSHRYVANRTAEILGKDLKDLKLITLHLGSGASITAFDHGQAIDTSMGFTPLAGITMSTRSGDIDASLIPFLMRHLGISDVQDFINILNNKSGLLGISGVSPDMRDLDKAAAEDNHQAELALEIFANRVVKYIGSYIAEMGGLDALVFTAGVGENSVAMRARITKQLGYFGITIDDEKNNVHGQERLISQDGGKVDVLVVPTNEELMIVRDVERLTEKSPI
ncbi:acetate kinase [Lactobacillus sp.] [Lactiplantibacillus mudanjiangensis]|uniref:acetate/propionate family kinase n=1 Tax=Lactiplantibacillus mudanjiangensis TaxID=1296538 RepID=UPI0010147E34|nr:acetate kinase [Lactiplantibacillus mudanjiangensis]VDG21094.1 acetate kinase [Lactobacillus sp.] [Lactiplantibacillus mudanjiangensis]VDG31694.1 acetate kinase [Lactobacillus sp.] [Lactiplantibacillus mudanjiangensis]